MFTEACMNTSQGGLRENTNLLFIAMLEYLGCKLTREKNVHT
jgi:hypothetical protein